MREEYKPGDLPELKVQMIYTGSQSVTFGTIRIPEYTHLLRLQLANRETFLHQTECRQRILEYLERYKEKGQLPVSIIVNLVGDDFAQGPKAGGTSVGYSIKNPKMHNTEGLVWYIRHWKCQGQIERAFEATLKMHNELMNKTSDMAICDLLSGARGVIMLEKVWQEHHVQYIHDAHNDRQEVKAPRRARKVR